MTIIETKPHAQRRSGGDATMLRWSVPEQSSGPASEYDRPPPMAPGIVLPAIHLTTAQDPAVDSGDSGVSVPPRGLSEVRALMLAVDGSVLGAFFVCGYIFERWVLTGSALVMLVLLVGRLMTLDRVAPMLATLPIVRLLAVGFGSASAVVALTGSAGAGRELVFGALGILGVLSTARLLLGMKSVRRLLRIPSGGRCFLVGNESALLPMVAERDSWPGCEKVVGMLLHPDHAPQVDGRDDAFSVEAILAAAMLHHADQVTVVPGGFLDTDKLRELSWALESTGIDLVLTTELQGVAAHRVQVNTVGDRVLMRIGSSVPRGWKAAAKGAFDRTAAAFLLIVLSPLLIGLSVAVRLDSPGRAIFRQSRVRRGGAEFTMYKFRTMHPNAEEFMDALRELNEHGAHGVLFKMKEDPRVTTLGRLLRRTSLDELPQLLNVLRGEMSLIGPRPALPSEVARYDRMAHRRLAVKPGMTGLWQVSGRSLLTWQESLRYDLDYVDNWTPYRETSIVFRTVRAVIKNDGAF